MALVASSLRLDHLAVQVSHCLRGAGVPHALIKGVTTARWLYPEGGRPYADVDLLVPFSRVNDAARALVQQGVVRRRHARLGEFAPHSLQLTAISGAEIDLHVTLPADPHPVSDRVWKVVSEHLVPFELDGETVPALEIPARCVVLAMHLWANDGAQGQAHRDLQLAHQREGEECWDRARVVARRLDLDAHLDVALDVVQGRRPCASRPDIALRLQGASGAALQWDRLRRLPWRNRWTALGREAFPSRAFMVSKYPGAGLGPAQLVRAYSRRHRTLLSRRFAAQVWLRRPDRHFRM